MADAAVLCTGPSMCPEIAERVRHLITVAVNTVSIATTDENGRPVPPIAPWATALAAQDRSFWTAHPHAHDFPRRKFSTNDIGQGVERVKPNACVLNSSCSGVLGLEVARMLCDEAGPGPHRILLLGCDMRGSHYFGRYTLPGTKNTGEKYRSVHVQQFALWARCNPKVEVINCTPDSALDVFPRMPLEAAL